MQEELQAKKLSKFELYLVYLARAISCIFIYAPLSNNTLTKWFIVMSAITCAMSVYGGYL